MIKYLKGDIFSSPAKVLVNAVNTVGVMGKGVALEFKKQYPEMFYRYKQLCENQEFKVGNLFLWKKETKWILMFPTKIHWRNPSKLEYIEMGLQKFVENWDKLGADSIAFPRLGCGNGGLRWEDVQPLMEKYLKNIPLQIYIYVDQYKDPAPEHLHVSEIEKWFLGQNEDLGGYEKFKQKLTALPSDYLVTLENGEKIVFETNRHQYDSGVCSISDEQLCSFWNFVRDAGIVVESEIPKEFSPFSRTMLRLMKYMEYLQPVIVSKNGRDFDESVNAYQYIDE